MKEVEGLPLSGAKIDEFRATKNVGMKLKAQDIRAEIPTFVQFLIKKKKSMNIKSFVLGMSACLFLLSPAFGQKNKPSTPAPETKPANIEVSESVVKMADWAGFKYRDILAAGQIGDQEAIKKFLEFSGTVDGTDAEKHAVTCLELIPVASDFAFAMSCHTLKPALKTVLLERLMLAQVRTKNLELREPMEQWAPITWSVLHGGPPTCNCEHNADGSVRLTAPPASAAGSELIPNEDTGH